MTEQRDVTDGTGEDRSEGAIPWGPPEHSGVTLHPLEEPAGIDIARRHLLRALSEPNEPDVRGTSPDRLNPRP